MCLKDLFGPDIPETKTPWVQTQVAQARVKDKEIKTPSLARQPDEKAQVEYGIKKPSEALLAKKRANKSIIPLNRAMLNTPGASQQGLGGTSA